MTELSDTGELKPPYSPQYQEMLDKVPIYLREHNIPKEQFEYWESEAKKIFNKYGRKFYYFSKGNDTLVDEGNTLMLDEKASGYNLLLDIGDLEINSSKKLLFYSCHASRSWHFGLLLAEMEHDELIKQEQIKFGIRGTRVLYSGWEIVPEDEFWADISSDKTKNPTTNVLDTVETVLTFEFDEDNQAALIGDFLVRKTRKAVGLNYIPGSWEVNDIRGTNALANLLEIESFARRYETIVCNVLRKNDSKSILLTLRQETKFSQEDANWDSPNSLQNKELVEVLAIGNIKP